MYLTGGIGSRHDRERFGPAFELPNLTGYLETCASIGMAFWNHRLFLLTGEGKFLDVLERAVYNGVLAGVSLEGNSFFYSNPLESDGQYKFNQRQLGRAPFFGVACCPGNVSRFIPSVPGYIYATAGDALYVNLFAGGTAKLDIGGEAVNVKQETRYPWEGAVRIALEPEKPAAFELRLRVPGWAQGRPVPTELYRSADAAPAAARIVLRVNGESHALDLDKGFARIRRTWKKGDVVEFVLPLDVRRVVAAEAVKDDAGKVAFERGPLVYCAEGPDNSGRVLDLNVADGANFAAEWRPDLLRGVVVLKGKASSQAKAADGSAAPPAERDVLLIPYYAWAHRGPGEMAVWLKRK
jgi:hypothetical protein